MKVSSRLCIQTDKSNVKLFFLLLHVSIDTPGRRDNSGCDYGQRKLQQLPTRRARHQLIRTIINHGIAATYAYITKTIGYVLSITSMLADFSVTGAGHSFQFAPVPQFCGDWFMQTSNYRASSHNKSRNNQSLKYLTQSLIKRALHRKKKILKPLA